VLVTSTNLISRARAWNEMRALIQKHSSASIYKQAGKLDIQSSSECK
jgi:hypothetical protein